MGTLCAEITEDQTLGCLSLVDGNESTLYLANKSDVLGYVRDPESPEIIRGIVMKEQTRFFKYEGTRTSLKPKFTYAADDYGDTYKHEIDAVIFNWSSQTKSEIKSLVRGAFVAVVVYKDKLNDSAIELYGSFNGLYVKNGLVRDINSADYGANVPFGIESRSNLEEPDMPSTFAVLVDGVYSYTATIDALNTLTIFNPQSNNSFEYTLNFTL